MRKGALNSQGHDERKEQETWRKNKHFGIVASSPDLLSSIMAFQKEKPIHSLIAGATAGGIEA